ncbi:MAG: hypothetical protein M1829_006468 [Trizodia sp. TS-e1964]|nr:MAG: hypothetical protein M1829_006468 [Trizodia sp. TS-e1964]
MATLPFLSLPSEIRLKIYSYHFGPPRILRPRQNSRWPQRTSTPFFQKRTSPLLLLLTSRQVYEEASHFYYTLHTFHLTTNHIAAHFLRSAGPYRRACLAHLIIEVYGARDDARTAFALLHQDSPRLQTLKLGVSQSLPAYSGRANHAARRDLRLLPGFEALCGLRGLREVVVQDLNAFGVVVTPEWGVWLAETLKMPRELGEGEERALRRVADEMEMRREERLGGRRRAIDQVGDHYWWAKLARQGQAQAGL